MLTNQSGWIAPLKQPFLAKSALYSILKQKVFKIWDISWEYSDTLVEFLDGLADKLKIKSFSKPKTLGKKKSPNCGTQFWSFFVQLKDFQVSFQHENTAPPFRISMKKDQNWVLQFGDFFLPRFLNKKHVFSSTFVLDGLSRATKVSLYSPQNSEYRCNYRARIAWNHSCNQVYSTIFVSKWSSTSGSCQRLPFYQLWPGVIQFSMDFELDDLWKRLTFWPSSSWNWGTESWSDEHAILCVIFLCV